MDGSTAKVKTRARELGADLVGVADLDLLREIECEPSDLLEPFRYALSLGVKIPNAVFEQLPGRPTPLYAQTYLAANAFLDQLALRICSYIEQSGFHALPIPASQPLDMKEFRSHLSAKAAANAAGLGWQGKSLLIVTPQYGPRVRFVTVLTDMPLEGSHAHIALAACLAQPALELGGEIDLAHSGGKKLRDLGKDSAQRGAAAPQQLKFPGRFDGSQLTVEQRDVHKLPPRKEFGVIITLLGRHHVEGHPDPGGTFGDHAGEFPGRRERPDIAQRAFPTCSLVAFSDQKRRSPFNWHPQSAVLPRSAEVIDIYRKDKKSAIQLLLLQQRLHGAGT